MFFDMFRQNRHIDTVEEVKNIKSHKQEQRGGYTEWHQITKGDLGSLYPSV